MRPPKEKVVQKLVGDWIHKAEQDLRAAETLVQQDPPLAYPVCFHSQQAAEKYLKAFLTRKQVEFSKTHNIGELLGLAGTVDEELANELLAASVLTPYGVEARYPGDLPEPSGSESKKALVLAKQVADAVTRRIEEGA